jgi:diaminopimelate decarboxylase
MITSQSERFPGLRHEIAGIPVRELARQFGTRSFVYAAAAIVRRIEDLLALDVIRYAQKACSNLAILDLVRRNGVLIDAVGAGEVHRSLAAGYKPHGDPPPVVYTADTFVQEALSLTVDTGIHVNCGSPDLIDQLGRRAPGRDITLRINLGFGHGHRQRTNTGGDHSKHGIWHEQLPGVLAPVARHGLKVTGLHVHIGSGTDLEHLSRVCGAYRTSRSPDRSIDFNDQRRRWVADRLSTRRS